MLYFVLGGPGALFVVSWLMPSSSNRIHRALRLLATSAEGCTTASMLAHGFGINVISGLVDDGLASQHQETVMAGGRRLEIHRLRITDAGWKRLRGK
jgi:hypothetical protein